MLYNELLKNISEDYETNAKYILNCILSEEEKTNKKKINIFKIIDFKIRLLKSKKYPIQYLVGSANFYGYDYKINKNVLIPRFETEELVENTIKKIKEMFDKNISILDLGTGSGCIGITLKRELKEFVDVTISDISKKALKVAKYNSKGQNIKIIQSNLFQNINKKYDVLISNPPYISYNEKIMELVRKNEPKIALYAPEKGLYFYEQILRVCKKILNSKYLIAFEIGESQAEDIKNLALKYLGNVEIEVKKDLNKRDRMIFITNKG